MPYSGLSLMPFEVARIRNKLFIVVILHYFAILKLTLRKVLVRLTPLEDSTAGTSHLLLESSNY